jgi:hypothetical protein
MAADTPPSPGLLAVCRTLFLVVGLAQLGAVIVASRSGPGLLDSITHLLFFVILYLLFGLSPFPRLLRDGRKAATPEDLRMALYRRRVVVTRRISRFIEANRGPIATYDVDQIDAAAAALETAISATRANPTLN